MTDARDRDPNAFYAGGLGVATYDLMAEASPFAGDVAFYLDCARRFGGPILELGTGTGRVLIPLAEAGLEVVGLDLSPTMLSLAAGKLKRAAPEVAARVRLIEGDMTRFDLGRRFRLVLIPARAFQHVTTPDGQRAALGAIHRHLELGGHLVIDLFDPKLDYCVPNPTATAALSQREARDPETGNVVRRTVVERHNDPLHQIVGETLRFEVVDPAGRILATHETSWALRWTLRQEMAYLLELCGFEPLEVFSDFVGSPPAYGAEQLWVARAR